MMLFWSDFEIKNAGGLKVNFNYVFFLNIIFSVLLVDTDNTNGPHHEHSWREIFLLSSEDNATGRNWKRGSHGDKKVSFFSPKRSVGKWKARIGAASPSREEPCKTNEEILTSFTFFNRTFRQSMKS